MGLVIPLLLLLGAIPLVVMLMRANELFCVRIDGERVRVARGRLPQRLLDDIGDVVARQGAHVVLRGVSEGGRPRMYVEGELDEPRRQRLRNALGQWTVGQIRTAPKPRR